VLIQRAASEQTLPSWAPQRESSDREPVVSGLSFHSSFALFPGEPVLSAASAVASPPLSDGSLFLLCLLSLLCIFFLLARFFLSLLLLLLLLDMLLLTRGPYCLLRTRSLRRTLGARERLTAVRA